jgi:hypothetical protein
MTLNAARSATLQSRGAVLLPGCADQPPFEAITGAPRLGDPDRRDHRLMSNRRRSSRPATRRSYATLRPRPRTGTRWSAQSQRSSTLEPTSAGLDKAQAALSPTAALYEQLKAAQPAKVSTWTMSARSCSAGPPPTQPAARSRNVFRLWMSAYQENRRATSRAADTTQLSHQLSARQAGRPRYHAPLDSSERRAGSALPRRHRPAGRPACAGGAAGATPGRRSTGPAPRDIRAEG